MVGQSEKEIQRVIEDEIAGYGGPQERHARLLKHTRELADRWIGIATIDNIPARSRVANDGFRALQVSLQMTRDSLRHAREKTQVQSDVERLVSQACELARSCDNSAIKEFIDLLWGTLLVDQRPD